MALPSSSSAESEGEEGEEGEDDQAPPAPFESSDADGEKEGGEEGDVGANWGKRRRAYYHADYVDSEIISSDEEGAPQPDSFSAHLRLSGGGGARGAVAPEEEAARASRRARRDDRAAVAQRCSQRFAAAPASHPCRLIQSHAFDPRSRRPGSLVGRQPTPPGEQRQQLRATNLQVPVPHSRHGVSRSDIRKCRSLLRLRADRLRRPSRWMCLNRFRAKNSCDESSEFSVPGSEAEAVSGTRRTRAIAAKTLRMRYEPRSS